MNDAEVKLQVKIDDSSASSSMDSMAKKSENLSKAFSSAGKKLTVGLTLPLVGLVAAGVKYNAEIEQLQTSFEVMTGSADKASEIIEKLKKVGAETPYELKGLAQTAQTLMQYGLTADEAYEATLNFGDIAQGSAEKMQGIALAYGQMSSAGKLNMQDIKQMINQGFNPLQAVADMTGETMKQVTARYDDNKISVDEVTKAMKFASSKGGKYYKSMEKQSQTTTGKLGTLKDGFNEAAGELTKSLIPVISKLLSFVTNLTNWFSKLSDSQKATVLVVIGLVAAIGPMLLIVAKLILAVKTVSGAIIAMNAAIAANPIVFIVILIASLIAALVLLYTKCEWFRNGVQAILSAIGGFFVGMYNVVMNVLSSVGNFFKNVFTGIWSFIKTIIDKISNAFNVLGNAIKTVFQAVRDTIVNIFTAIGGIIKAPINAIIESINKVLKSINKIKIPSWVPKIGGESTNFKMIPTLQTGTNYVPQTGLAYLHQGEAVVPKKYNPAAGGFGGGMTIMLQQPDIIMDGNKVGRATIPYITKTVKLSGGNV